MAKTARLPIVKTSYLICFIIHLIKKDC